MNTRRGGMAVAGLAAALLVAGCSPFGSGYADLDRPREASDELPSLDGRGYGSVDVSTSRYAGEHEGTSVWIAEGEQEGSQCLVVVPEDKTQWSVGCARNPGISSGGQGGSFQVVPNGGSIPEPAIRLSENVIALNGSASLRD